MTSQYAPLILAPVGAGEREAKELARLPLGSTAGGRTYDEAFVQELFFRHPGALPISLIDNAFADPVPICMEMQVGAGYLDALFINSAGMPTVAEFKLWRNPEARREVVGQILDYAKELARWDYEDLQRETSRVLKREGNALFELIKVSTPGLDEARFIDDVTRNLRKGRFLLLIIGDGIREGVESIVDYLQQHTSLHFTIGLVEAAIFQLSDQQLLVQPRILARSLIVNRTVVDLADERMRALDGSDEPPATESSGTEIQNQAFWTKVLSKLRLDDATQRVPEAKKNSNAYFMLGFTSEIWLSAFIQRTPGLFGVYLSRPASNQFGSEAFDRLLEKFDELKEEAGEDLEAWTNASGAGRIGFRSEATFLADPSLEDDCAMWLRERINRLVNAVRPRIKDMWEQRD